MKFEFDPANSEANRRKHGVSLATATQIWRDAYLEATARTVDEPRFMALGKVREKLYACIYTVRGERLRLISCRRARGREVELYHAYFKEKHGEGKSHGG
jgi:uncharacterized DUF497 family protein